MNSHRLLAGIVGAGLIITTGGFVASQPASAASGDNLECANGSFGIPGNDTQCILSTATGSPSQEAWYLDGGGPVNAGKILFTFNCGTRGATHSVKVTYLDGSGVSSQLTATTTPCGTPTP